MADKPVRIEVDCSTGEQKIVELTAEEIAELEAARKHTEALVAQQQKEAEEKETLKAAALAKLAELGLTEEEAKALAG